MMFMDGGDIFRYHRWLKVVVAEDYGEGDASYYAVAVAKSDLPSHVSMLALEGMKSCHTGVGKTSGWNTPIGWIARNRGVMNSRGQVQLYDPFTVSCAPGANIASYQNIIPNAGNQKWCALCIGNNKGDHICERDSDELYYGYKGALQCMKDGMGDIAFVKHTTATDDEDKNNFILLCPDGSRKHPDQWRDCNLAKVPAHGLVMNKPTEVEATKIYNMLEDLRKRLGNQEMFGDKRDLLWKSSTKAFLFKFDSAVNYLGAEYYCNMLVLNGMNLLHTKGCFNRTSDGRT
ncbi:serotransferrin-1-like [Styela clava]